MKHYLAKFIKSINILGPSRKFFIICLAFIFGVGLHSLTKFERWQVLITEVFVCAVLFIALSFKFKTLRFPVFLCLVFLAGILLYEQNIKISMADTSVLNDQKVTLRGVILEDPDVRLDHQKIKLTQIYTKEKGNRHEIDGTLLVRAMLYPELNYGDVLEITCRLQKPEPVRGFAYDEYLARFNIYSVCFRPDNLVIIERGKGNIVMQNILFLKNKLSENISASLPEPYASLARGTALGERGGISYDIQENFRRVGLSHILAISGFNITIVVYIIGLLIKSTIKNKKVRFIVISTGIIFFVLLVGADASVVRAAIMGSLILLAKSSARVPPPRITLSSAGAAMLAINPKLFAFDRGFLLSFAATIGIIYFSPLLKSYLERSGKKLGEARRFFGELFYSTSSAIIFTLPPTIYFFSSFSFVALPINLLVVPITPIIMIGSLALGIFGAMPFVNIIISPIIFASIYYMNALAKWGALIPFSSIQLTSMHWIAMPIFYGIIFVSMFFMKKKLNILKLQLRSNA